VRAQRPKAGLALENAHRLPPRPQPAHRRDTRQVTCLGLPGIAGGLKDFELLTRAQQSNVRVKAQPSTNSSARYTPGELPWAPRDSGVLESESKALNSVPARYTPGDLPWASRVGLYKIQDIVLLLGLCARINTILCAPTLCLGTHPTQSSPKRLRNTRFPPRPPRYCNIYHTILAMVILCKGQFPG